MIILQRVTNPAIGQLFPSRDEQRPPRFREGYLRYPPHLTQLNEGWVWRLISWCVSGWTAAKTRALTSRSGWICAFMIWTIGWLAAQMRLMAAGEYLAARGASRRAICSRMSSDPAAKRTSTATVARMIPMTRADHAGTMSSPIRMAIPGRRNSTTRGCNSKHHRAAIRLVTSWSRISGWCDSHVRMTIASLHPLIAIEGMASVNTAPRQMIAARAASDSAGFRVLRIMLSANRKGLNPTRAPETTPAAVSKVSPAVLPAHEEPKPRPDGPPAGRRAKLFVQALRHFAVAKKKDRKAANRVESRQTVYTNSRKKDLGHSKHLSSAPFGVSRWMTTGFLQLVSAIPCRPMEWPQTHA